MRRLLPLLLACAAALAAVPASASAAGASCPAQRGTLAKERLGRVWHQGRSLYACTIAGDARPRARRMGPWTPSTRVAFDGASVAWTTRVQRDGARVDRLWAGAAIDGSRWLSGAQAVPASDAAPAGEARVVGLRSLGTSVAWVTDGSALALAAEDPGDSEPVTLATPPATLVPVEDRLLVGAWPATPPAELARSLRLARVPGQGDGDDCGGVDVFTASVRPRGATAPEGASWSSSYSTRSQACNTL